MEDIFDMAVTAAPESTTTLPERTTYKWDPRLIADLALGLDSTQEVLDRYELSHEQYDKLSQNPSFRHELALMIKELNENGTTFHSTARVQAMSYLEIVDEIVNNTLTPAATRLSAIKDTVRWGKLEPKEDKSAGDNGNTINLQINFAT